MPFARQPVGRYGPVCVELVYKHGYVYVNFFVNGTQVYSFPSPDKEITIPEALILLATEIRMGHIIVPQNKGV
jgi:hypothetical protein